MASSSSNGGLFREETQGNPFEIIGITPDTSFKDAHKQYLKQMRKHHSDKVGGDDSFSKLLTQAWKLLNDTDGDADKLTKLAKQFSASEGDGATSPQNIDLNKVFTDKSKSTEFRELFRSILKQKEKLQFKENFQYVYGQIFAKVEVHKKAATLKPEFQCEICDGEEFILLEDHFKAVFHPYYDFVMDVTEKSGSLKRKGFKKYLSDLFGDEVVGLSTKSVQSMDYTVHISNDTDQHFRKMMESFQQNSKQSTSKTEQLILMYSTLCEKSDMIVNIMENDTRIPSVIQAVLESVSYHDDGEDLPCVEHYCCCDALIPALIKTKRPEFKKWYELAVKIYDRGFKDWSLVFVKAAIYFGDEDACVKLAEHLIHKKDYERAHHCFSKIGCCDLNAIGHTLASKKIGSKMAAQYLVKTEDVKGLLLHGKSYCSADGSGNRNQAAMFLIPLIFMFKKRGQFNEAIEVLRLLLPKSMYFRSVQELATDLIEKIDDFSFYECEGFADAVLFEVERICGDTLLGKVPDMYDEENGILSLKTDDRLKALNALPGALHVLFGSPNKDNYTDPSGICERLVTPLLTEALYRKQFELVFILAKCPGMKENIEKILTENRMLQQVEGGMDRKFTPGQFYGSGLLLLRAIYNYKKNRISDMLSDLDKANLLAIGHSKLMKPIVTFIVSTPMVHEKIVNMMTSQFLELHKFLEGKCRTPFPETETIDLLSDVMSHTGFLSDHLNLGAILVDKGRKGPLLEVVEKKILMNSDAPDEVALNYLDLAEMAPGLESTISSYIQAIAHFYKAMQSNEDITMKYAYMQLIEKVCEELDPYTTIAVTGAYFSLYGLRTKLSFLLRAHFHLNQAIRELNEQTNFSENLGKFFSRLIFKSITGLSCGSNEKIPDLVGDWQNLLNLRLLCPLSTTEIYAVGDGNLALCLGSRINNRVVLEKVDKYINENWGNVENSKRFLYDHHLFHELWRQRLEPELFYEKLLNFKEDENLLVSQTKAFQITKERIMQSAAKWYGYDLNEVENMMFWHRIRRTRDGFMDTSNRTLNFDGEKAYTQLTAVNLDLVSHEYSLLLQEEDTTKNMPGLFGWTDIAEIFGNGICGSLLSFEREDLESKMDASERIQLHFFPFFKVEFTGLGPDGKMSKERICGTNFLMTLYHADLLAKILTTGQEAGASYPFLYKDTRTGLLQDLPKPLAKILDPIGPRKQADKLRQMEHIHRFWFHVKEVEKAIDTDSTNGKVTIRFGDVTLELRVMRMVTDKNGKLVDAEHLLDPESPEVKFVKGFNENIGWIMEYFPILRRMKELAKISLCYQLLFANKENFKKIDLNFERIFNKFSLPTWRPYSQCVKGEKCECCDWVPAVFHEMTVTDEQKLNYLWRNMGREDQTNAICGDQAPMLTSAARGAREGSPIPGSSSCGSSRNGHQGNPKKPKVNIKDYDLLERYKVYGGVCFIPTSKNVTGMPQRCYSEKVNLTWNYGISGYGNTGYKAAGASSTGNPGGNANGNPGGNAPGNPGGNGNGNNNNKKGRQLLPHDPQRKNEFPNDRDRLGHIFRDKKGHFPTNTPQARKQLTQLVTNEKNYVTTDMHGKRWYFKTLRNGEQLWAFTQKNVLWDGGKNKADERRRFNPETGMFEKDKLNGN